MIGIELATRKSESCPSINPILPFAAFALSIDYSRMETVDE
ncbi:MAG: hypothetical protein OJF50_000011 [Nitrospira sp.]|nr:hypothetical protein [Nitrospira sp.]